MQPGRGLAVAALALAIGGCTHAAPRLSATPANGGSFTPGQRLEVELEVATVQMDMSDSIRAATWTMESKPAGCATAEVSDGRIAASRRGRHCTSTWRIATPPIADLNVRVGVGDVTLTVPLDRSVGLHSDVGRVKLVINGRELHASRDPGSGDDLRLGESGTLPRVDASVDVGDVRVEMRSPK